MKELYCVICCLGILSVLFNTSCLKSGGETILVNDPQEIPLITEYIPNDLLQLFGESNVYFGDVPPIINSSFITNHEYVATNITSPLCPQPGQMTPILYYHEFYDQYLAMTNYRSKTSESDYINDISPIYVTGHDNFFTAYFYRTVLTWGIPTYAVVISGELTTNGIKNYRYGLEIVKYLADPVPQNVYPIGTVFIFKDPNGISYFEKWY